VVKDFYALHTLLFLTFLPFLFSCLLLFVPKEKSDIEVGNGGAVGGAEPSDLRGPGRAGLPWAIAGP
jgi:hypothetical protein